MTSFVNPHPTADDECKIMNECVYGHYTAALIYTTFILQQKQIINRMRLAMERAL